MATRRNGGKGETPSRGTRRPKPLPEDRSTAPSLLEGVKPLKGGPKVVAPPFPSRTGFPPRASPHQEPGAIQDSEQRFEVVTSGERIEGIAAGIDRAHLRRLRSGELRLDARIDLHGLTAKAARLEVRRALLAAYQEDLRCVLVVHGRGQHSVEGPVLKAFLLRWLTEPPLANLVMAFASARPADGGTGAVYVLLRRQR